MGLFFKKNKFLFNASGTPQDDYCASCIKSHRKELCKSLVITQIDKSKDDFEKSSITKSELNVSILKLSITLWVRILVNISQPTQIIIHKTINIAYFHVSFILPTKKSNYQQKKKKKTISSFLPKNFPIITSKNKKLQETAKSGARSIGFEEFNTFLRKQSQRTTETNTLFVALTDKVNTFQKKLFQKRYRIKHWQ